MKQYGDEDFIFLIQEEAESAEPAEKHVNDIQDGYIILHEEKILFQTVPISSYGFSMILPELFAPMSKELAELKYPSARRPDFILSNPRTTINLTFNYRGDKMSEEQTEDARTSIQKVMMKMQRSKAMESKTILVEDKKVAYFDFISSAIDSDIYNLMFFFSLKETMLMGAFNCLEPDRHDWKEIVLQMLQSIKFL